MREYLIGLALATLPALANFAGGLLAEAFSVSRRILSLALHAAAGIVLAVVAVELMPQALEVEAPWIPILAFVGGGAFLMIVDQAIGLIRNRFGGGEAGAGPWAVFAGFALPILLGTTIGYWAVRGQPEIFKLALLAFTAGILTTVVVEEIVPEAHQDGEARLASLVFVGGFALFALLSAYLD